MKYYVKVGIVAGIIHAMSSLLAIIPEPWVVLTVIPVICLTWFVIPFVAGFYGAKFVGVVPDFVGTMLSGVKQGAIAAVIAAIIDMLVRALVAMILGLPEGMSIQIALFALVIGSIVILIINVVFGALGGAVRAFLEHRKAIKPQ